MSHLPQKKELFSSKKAVLVSFSGGPDSVYLLERLIESVPNKLINLVYFDHQLRSESERLKEQQLVTKIAADKNVTLITRKLPVFFHSKKYGCSLEESGRHLRHALLCHHAKRLGIKSVLTGHHEDDSYETFFHRLIRGTKSQLGLMPYKQQLANITLVRPLLNMPKKEILSYLDTRKIAYSTDSSNDDLRFSRNKIRHQIIPAVAEINPGYKKNIRKLSTYLEEVHTYFDDLLQDISVKYDPEKQAVSLSLSVLLALPTILLKRVFYKALREVSWQTKLFFSSNHVDLLEKLVNRNGDTFVCLPGGWIGLRQGSRIIIQKMHSIANNLEFSHEIGTFPSDISIPEINKTIIFSIPASTPDRFTSSSTHSYINFDPVGSEGLLIRNRRSGDKFKPYGSDHTHSLKKYLINRKWPRFQRQLIPLFFHQNKLVWVAGLQVSNDYKVTSETKQILRIDIR